jgi:hypothetical protein
MASIQEQTAESRQKRFAQTSEDEIQRKQLKINAENTIRANKKCAREYLKENKQNSEFETFDRVRLNETLSHLYVDIRKPDGQRYKATSLESIRHGLNRYLRSSPHNKPFYIVKDADINDSNTNVSAMLTEVTRLGLGNVVHYPAIDKYDREKLYKSVYFSTNTPSGLSNKVQFDIRLYFCRRGQENMHAMSQSMFTVKTDGETGLRYVTEDELTKNHRETDKELISGVMPASPGKAKHNKRCVFTVTSLKQFGLVGWKFS